MDWGQCRAGQAEDCPGCSARDHSCSRHAFHFNPSDPSTCSLPPYPLNHPPVFKSSASLHPFLPCMYHSLIHSFTHSLIHSFASWLLRSFASSLIRSFPPSIIRSFAHSLIHSFTHSLIHSSTHSLIHSFPTHSISEDQRSRRVNMIFQKNMFLSLQMMLDLLWLHISSMWPCRHVWRSCSLAYGHLNLQQADIGNR